MVSPDLEIDMIYLEPPVEKVDFAAKVV